MTNVVTTNNHFLETNLWISRIIKGMYMALTAPAALADMMR